MAILSDEDREIIADFVTEGSEAIEKAEPTLLKLEDNLNNGLPLEASLIDTIFRTFHSIKGSAGFIGLQTTNSLTHDAETLLDFIRKGKIELKKKHIDIFLEVCDQLQRLLDKIMADFAEEGFEDSVANLKERLQVLSGKDNEKEENQKGAASKTKILQNQEPSAKKSSSIATEEDLITPEMVDQFVVESREIIENLEQDLLTLEEDPTNMESVESAFRGLHSLKGNAGLYNYKDINELSHKAEFFLDNARQKKMVASSKQISLILQILDFFSQALDSLEAGKKPLIPAKIGIMDLMDEMFVGVNDTAGETEREKEPEKDIVEKTAETPQPPVPKEENKSKTVQKNSATNEVIRVDVGKLNELMDLVGEIVIAESMVYQNYKAFNQEELGFEKSLGYLQKNVRELQDLATSMRLIPLSGVFSKMKRLVRDISAKKKNKVDLHVLGGDTEVDRSIIEHISDPLVHILRNSIDHGIEMPDERQKRGKNPHGSIKLSAKRVGGEIWISIEDDGTGLKKDKILNKAIEKGLVSDGGAAELTDHKIYNMIFMPGFSTVEKVTNLSGRGVGMDVVSRNIEKIRGRVEVESSPGKGASFNLKIPLTTAIVDGMLMRVNDSIYAIPKLDIKESLQITQDQVVDLLDGQEIIKVRESLIPVLRLQELHKLGGETKKISEGIVVVTEIAGTGVAFLVDEIVNQQQLVVKALPKYFGKLEGVSGCAILGNGDICLILDLSNLLKKVHNKAKSNTELVEAS
jgi:two-component system chemotaxis sensor kinase CheA